jgi:hypothetical protein
MLNLIVVKILIKIFIEKLQQISDQAGALISNGFHVFFFAAKWFYKLFCFFQLKQFN